MRIYNIINADLYVCIHRIALLFMILVHKAQQNSLNYEMGMGTLSFIYWYAPGLCNNDDVLDSDCSLFARDGSNHCP